MKCNFMLWPGAGYVLDGPFTVESELLTDDNLELAVELLAAYLIDNNLTDYYLTDEQYIEVCRDCDYNPEDYDGDDLEGYLYVDGTMEGAKFPIYLGTENMRFEFSA